MSEVEKMYRNAHVYPRVYGDITKDTFENKVFNMADMCNEAFTAEKQLNILKIIVHSFTFNALDKPIWDKGWDIAIAKLVNIYWEVLTDTEKSQIKEILE